MFIQIVSIKKSNVILVVLIMLTLSSLTCGNHLKDISKLFSEKQMD